MAYNRSRSKGPDLDDSGSLTYEYRINNGTSWTTQSSGTTIDLTVGFSDEVMEDVVTPKFFSRKARGEIIVNPMHHRWRKWTRGDVNWYGHRPANLPYVQEADYSWNGASFAAVGDPLPDNSGILDSLVTEASTRLLANINAAAVQGLVIGGEIRSTLRLLRSPLQGIVKLVSKGRSRPSRNNFYKAASNAWLSGRYGWRPLLYDIQDIMDAANERHSRRLTERVNLSATSTSDDETTGTRMSHANCVITREAQHAHIVRAGAIVEISPDFGYSAGVRLRDIPRALWDLLPYSFVADWFANIGNYIDASISSSNSKVIASWVVKDSRTSQIETITPGQYSDYTDKPSGSVVNTYYLREKVRGTGLAKPGIVSRIGSMQRLFGGADLRQIDTIFLLGGVKGKFGKGSTRNYRL